MADNRAKRIAWFIDESLLERLHGRQTSSSLYLLIFGEISCRFNSAVRMGLVE